LANAAEQGLPPLARVALVAVGLGCMLAYCRAFATGFSGGIPMAGRPEMDVLSSACSIARVAAIAVAVVLGCALRVSPGRIVLAGSGLAMAVAGLVLAGGCGVAEGMPFALLAGVASGLVMLAMLMLLSSLSMRDIVIASFGGLLAGGVLIGGLMRLDALPATAVFVASGLFAGLMFPLADPKGTSCRADGIPTAAQVAEFPWFAALAFAISGIVASLLYGAAIALGWNAGGSVNYPLFGAAAVFALAASAYIVLQGEEAAAAAWIPLFALVLAAMLLACVSDARVNPSMMGLLFAGVFSYHFLRWMVFPALISFSRMPRLLVCGIVLVCTSSVFGVGWGESLAVSLPGSLHDQRALVAVIALALLVFFAAALLVNRTRLEDARMSVESARMELSAAYAKLESLAQQIEEQPEPAQPSIDDRCAALTREYGLTAREAEILGLTARGHSSTFIAEQLVISASTVRFHQQNVYRKLDVHSRQELLALVNDKETK